MAVDEGVGADAVVVVVVAKKMVVVVVVTNATRGPEDVDRR